ncbi:cycling DOF factor 3 [Hibiscus trionum]|uniref:Cycling DOF factor 3 n=1 Tax=Hibiscus trionum TaxID=183268 RepID=A0A9W7LQR8_HIBTR|nr:cycling DOF factor 3 [Hibiscus trionum]
MNGRVLSFGLDASICDFMASVLNLGEKKVLNGTQNGFHCLEGQRVSVAKGKMMMITHVDLPSRFSNSMDEGGRNCIEENIMENINGFPPPIPYLPGVLWPYLWNSAVPSPAFCPLSGDDLLL